MTYGQIRGRLSKLVPGIDLELWDGWIQDRYTEILDKLPWKRLEQETIIQSPASYQTGTVAATQGSNAIVGTGTTWTAAMSGLMIRINNTQEFYTFTYVSPTTATLDRAYEQPSASLLAFRIDQAVFTLPAAVRIIRGVRSFHPPRNLVMATPGELNGLAPGRLTYGYSRYAVPTWDSNSNPPCLQVEFYPIPSSPDSLGETLSFSVDAILDQALLDPTQTVASLLPWLRPAALIAGCRADAAFHLKDYNAATAMENRFNELVIDMKRNNALDRGPQALSLAPNLRGGLRAYPGYHRGKHADRDYFGLDDYDA